MYLDDCIAVYSVSWENGIISLLLEDTEYPLMIVFCIPRRYKTSHDEIMIWSHFPHS